MKCVNYKLVGLLLVLAVLLFGCVGQQPPQATPTPLQATASISPTLAAPPLNDAVRITSDGFEPTTLRAKTGQIITWVNEDTGNHSLVFVDWESPAIEPKTGVTRSFDSAGEYSYVDGENPDLKGTVVVVD